MMLPPCIHSNGMEKECLGVWLYTLCSRDDDVWEVLLVEEKTESSLHNARQKDISSPIA